MALTAMMSHTHDVILMLVAVVVSVVSAFTGLALTRKIVGLPQNTRKTLVSMSSIVIGGGIWTMHFVAMLANEFTVPVDYDVTRTLSSGLLAILVAGVALLVLHFSARTVARLNMAGLILACGIMSMHYLGMSAMRGLQPAYTMSSVILSAFVAVSMGIWAIRIAYGRRSREHIIAGAVLLGLSVVAVHYTAMQGTSYVLPRVPQDVTISIENTTLGIALVFSVFIICGAFLLVATTFLTSTDPSQAGYQGVGGLAFPSLVGVGATEQGLPVQSPREFNVIQSRSAVLAGEISATLASSAPIKLDGSGESSQSGETNQSGQSSDMVDPVVLHEGGRPSDQRIDGSAGSGGIRIPYEKNKKIHFLDCTEVAALRADGRYTQLYTVKGIFFCPWSITEADSHLVDCRFFRTHRSYLINLSQLSSFEKRKDGGVCRFDDFDCISSVPVARTRVAGLQDLLGIA